jgi:hypothetical protein
MPPDSLTARRRLAIRFGVIGALAFVALSIGTARFMIHLIGWWVSNCGTGPNCATAGWLIDFWWAVYTPLLALVLLLIGAAYNRRLARLAPPAVRD